MNLPIGLENGDENRSVAWVLGHPGCYAYGPGPETALQAVPQAIVDYAVWICSYNGQSWIDPEYMQVVLDESWQVFSINENYERVDEGYSVNAWFIDDWKPLKEEDIERGLKLLSWSRIDLLNSIENLSTERMTRQYPGERWNIEGILKHVANAEWWYLDRLNLAFPRGILHNDVFERLEKVRSHLNGILSTLLGSNKVVGRDGEIWSSRKLLRRAVWHERDHTAHILQLINNME